MAIQFSTSVRSARLDAIESEIRSSAILVLFTGSQPANCATADSGTRLASLHLPGDYLSAATAGTKDKLGTWTGVASAAGTIGYFRVKNSAESVAHIQGAVTSTGGAGDLKFDNIDTVTAQTITITSFTLTDGNA